MKTINCQPFLVLAEREQLLHDVVGRWVHGEKEETAFETALKGRRKGTNHIVSNMREIFKYLCCLEQRLVVQCVYRTSNGLEFQLTIQLSD
jgi:hypothetical protein